MTHTPTIKHTHTHTQQNQTTASAARWSTRACRRSTRTSPTPSGSSRRASCWCAFLSVVVKMCVCVRCARVCVRVCVYVCVPVCVYACGYIRMQFERIHNPESRASPSLDRTPTRPLNPNCYSDPKHFHIYFTGRPRRGGDGARPRNERRG